MPNIGLLAVGLLVLLWAVCIELNYRQKVEEREHDDKNETK